MRTPRRRLLATTPNADAPHSAILARLHLRRHRYALNRQLIDALTHGDTETALTLVNAGADPNTRAEPTAVPALKHLLKQHLHPSPSPVNSTPTALMLACGIQRNTTTGELFLAVPYTDDEEIYAANMAKILRMVELLLQHGADINVQDERGHTPLMWAIEFGMETLARLLLAHGADLNVQSLYGHTALHYVVMSQYVLTLIPDLLAHGADLTLRNVYNYIPLELAQKWTRPDLFELLKEGVPTADFAA